MTVHSNKRVIYNLIKIFFFKAALCGSVDVNALLFCNTADPRVCTLVRVLVRLCLGGFVCVVTLV